MLDALTEEITYARKASECSESRQVYILRSGKQVIGSFAITTKAEDEYGVAPWAFAEESFDLSYLLGQTLSATAPMDYPVSVNGVRLDDSYVISQRSEQIAFLEDYYENYDLPEFIVKSYEAGPFLGDVTIQVTDPEGNAYVFDEASFDKDSLAHNCTAEQTDELNAFIQEFLKRYIIFAGCPLERIYHGKNL